MHDGISAEGFVTRETIPPVALVQGFCCVFKLEEMPLQPDTAHR